MVLDSTPLTFTLALRSQLFQTLDGGVKPFVRLHRSLLRVVGGSGLLDISGFGQNSGPAYACWTWGATPG